MKDLQELRKEINQIDDDMAALFVKRMAVSKEIASVKEENGLPVYDPKREQKNLEKASSRVPEELIPYYRDFLQKNMDLSKDYQHAQKK